MKYSPIYHCDLVYIFYTFYLSREFGNRGDFCKKLEKYNIPNRDAVLLWQGFDMAEGHKNDKKRKLNIIMK